MMRQVRFRVRPGYQSSDLLIEVLGDHRADGFPAVAEILRKSLHAVQAPHPDRLDNPDIALTQDQFFSYWAYPGGHYEISDDTWGLFVLALANNQTVIADLERALLASGKFVKESVDFDKFR